MQILLSRSLALMSFAFVAGIASLPSSPAARSSTDEIAPTRMMIGAESLSGGQCLATPLMSACVAPGTPDHVIAQIDAYMWKTFYESRQGRDGGVAYNLANRWSGGGQGDPRFLRWSVVPDGLFIPSGVGEPAGNSNLRAIMPGAFGSVAAGIDLIRQSMNRWGELTGITMVEIANDDGAPWGSGGATTRGDIRIGGHPFGPTSVLAYASFPDNGDIVVNTTENWSFSANNWRYFRNTIMHEVGHATGLFHVCPQNNSKLMEPINTTNFDGPQHDDIRANQRHYGDPREHNDTIATATNLGTFASFLQQNVSIDDNSDVDFYRFTAPANQRLNITVLPIGFIYNTAAQQGQNCPLGVSINSRNYHDLTLQLIATDGVTVLSNQNETGLGGTERVLNYDLPAAGGQFYFRVGTISFTEDVQMYQVSITLETVAPPACPADLNGDGSIGPADLGIMLGSWGTPGCGGSPCPADLNGDGSVGAADLGALLGAWGPC